MSHIFFVFIISEVKFAYQIDLSEDTIEYKNLTNKGMEFCEQVDGVPILKPNCVVQPESGNFQHLEYKVKGISHMKRHKL